MRLRELYSHPDKLLVDHLSEVRDNILELWRRAEDSLIEEMRGENYKLLLSAVALLHDLGKGTSYFQNKLLRKGFHPEKQHGHSIHGAIYLVWRLRDLFPIEDMLIGYMVIRGHHTSLSSSINSLSDLLSTSKRSDDPMIEYFEDLMKVLTETNQDLITMERTYHTIPDELFHWIEEQLALSGLPQLATKPSLRELLRAADSLLEQTKFFKYLSRVDKAKLLYTFSLLVSADRYSAAGYRKLHLYEFPFKAVELPKYLEVITKGKYADENISRLRAEALREAMDNLRRVGEHDKLILNLPTGLGKTFINFSVATHELSGAKHMVYSLPFTSIVDQVYELFSELANELSLESPNVVVRMHHAAPRLLEDNDNLRVEELYSDLGASELSDWNSSMIVTTFVQLMETIITGKPTPVRRLHRLAGGVVVIDEPQAIPTKYWGLVREAVDEISRALNTKFIISTATVPYLLREGYNLISEPSRYLLNRYSLTYLPNLNDERELIDMVSQEIVDGKRVLVLLNTVACARRVYRELRARFPEVKMYYLSRAVTPIERASRLRALKRGDAQVIVSTQVVEAGVDMDVDVAFRDFAPLDSVVQTAGRVNRNALRPYGDVYLVKLRDPMTNRFFHSYIYDKILTATTEELLLSNTTLSEPELFELVNHYFSILRERKESNAMVDSWRKNRFDHLVRFSLIDNAWEVSIYVELDEESKELWQAFKRALSIKDRDERFRVLEGLKPEIAKRVINVSLNKAVKGLELKDTPYWRIPLDRLESFYDEEVGFFTSEEGYLIV